MPTPNAGAQLTLQEADLMGIPYVVMVTESSLFTGVVHLRDRESDWFEQVHAAHIIPRLVLVYEGFKAAKEADAKIESLIKSGQGEKTKVKKRERKTSKKSEKSAKESKLEKETSNTELKTKSGANSEAAKESINKKREGKETKAKAKSETSQKSVEPKKTRAKAKSGSSNKDAS